MYNESKILLYMFSLEKMHNESMTFLHNVQQNHASIVYA